LSSEAEFDVEWITAFRAINGVVVEQRHGAETRVELNAQFKNRKFDDLSKK